MIAGLDIGSRRDPTALVRLSPELIIPSKGDRRSTVRDLTSMTGRLSEQRAKLVPLLRSCALVAVDATGLGLGLAEALEEEGLRLLRVQIVAGKALVFTTADHRGGAACVGHAWLMGRLIRAITSHELIVSPECPNRAILLAELQGLVPKWKQRGRLRIEAGHGHDDAAMALALALLASDVHAHQARQVDHGPDPRGAGAGRRRPT